MSILLNGDCLDEMKDIDDNSIDLIFCDLPYATKTYSAVSCKWNTPIDLEKFWIEVMRIKKINTPLFFTTTTKFGVELINSAPKKCPFRYDIVWVKSAPAGFLSAKKMPMRKHEMIYVFYEKLPFYDLSSHTHKFIKQYQEEPMDKSLYGPMPKTGKDKESHSKQYDPPLPVSVIKEEIKYDVESDSETYGNIKRNDFKDRKNSESRYDPPLPTSVVKEDCYNMNERHKNGKMKDMRKITGYDPPLPVSVVKEEKKQTSIKPSYYMKDGKTIYNGGKAMGIFNKGGTAYDPPLPTSVVKEETDEEYIQPITYGKNSSKKYNEGFAKKQGYNKNQVLYDPPLPVSVVKEVTSQNNYHNQKVHHYTDENGKRLKEDCQGSKYDPPLPVSVVKEDIIEPNKDCELIYGENANWGKNNYTSKERASSVYDPPLPTTMLEVKSTRGKHSTEKPVALMEWVLKYYSKEGDTILDPTMGSGSTGVACKNMKRNFIGIEMDKEIYEVAVNRIEN